MGIVATPTGARVTVRPPGCLQVGKRSVLIDEIVGPEDSSSSVGKPLEFAVSNCQVRRSSEQFTVRSLKVVSNLLFFFFLARPCHLSPQNVMSTLPTVDAQEISEILEYPGPFRDDEEQEECRRLVEELSPEEQETAARTSYAYWRSSTSSPSDAEVRIRSAMKEARRHLVGEDGDFDKALENLKNTCRFRQVRMRARHCSERLPVIALNSENLLSFGVSLKEYKVDLLRLCFGNAASVEPRDSDEKEFLLRSESLIEAELQRQTMYVRGQDRDNRAILHRSYRTSAESDQESYVLAMIYMAERAFACSEALTKGREEKIMCVFDYSGYSSWNSPPIETTKTSILLVQKNYPERAKKIVVLDAPFWMRGFYSIISLFLAEVTREKVHFHCSSQV